MAADELRNETGFGGVEHIACRTRLFDHRVVHHDDLVGQGQCLVLPVGDVDEADAQFRLQLFQLATHTDAQERVERGQRFIQQQNLRAL